MKYLQLMRVRLRSCLPGILDVQSVRVHWKSLLCPITTLPLPTKIGNEIYYFLSLSNRIQFLDAKTHLFYRHIPFVVLQCKPFAHNLLSMRLHTSQCKQLCLKYQRIFIGVHFNIWETFTAPLDFDCEKKAQMKNRSIILAMNRCKKKNEKSSTQLHTLTFICWHFL